MRRIISICKEVPLLPIAIIAAIPLALLGSWRPWEAAGVSLTFGPFNPGVGQWIVIALVVYTIVVTVIGMIDDLRHGHVGVDLLAVIAIEMLAGRVVRLGLGGGLIRFRSVRHIHTGGSCTRLW